MSYMSTESDTGVWIKRSATENGTAYYKYMLVNVDYVQHLEKVCTGRYVESKPVLSIEERFWATRYISQGQRR